MAMKYLRQTKVKLLREFCSLQPETFTGLEGVWQAEQWICQMDLIFKTIECSDEEKRRLDVFQLTFAAIDWWELEKATLGEEAI